MTDILPSYTARVPFLDDVSGPPPPTYASIPSSPLLPRATHQPGPSPRSTRRGCLSLLSPSPSRYSAAVAPSPTFSPASSPGLPRHPFQPTPQRQHTTAGLPPPSPATTPTQAPLTCRPLVDPYTGSSTPLPPFVGKFEIVLENTTVRMRGVEEAAAATTDDGIDAIKPAARNRGSAEVDQQLQVLTAEPEDECCPNADPAHGFQRGQGFLRGTVHIALSGHTESDVRTLSAISVRVRGVERTYPSHTEARGCTVVLDSRITVWRAPNVSTTDPDAVAAFTDLVLNGKKEIGFTVTVPPHCPASFGSRTGSVEYYVDATLYRRVASPPHCTLKTSYAHAPSAVLAIIRHPFIVSRAPTKLELERYTRPLRPVRGAIGDVKWEWTGPTVVWLNQPSCDTPTPTTPGIPPTFTTHFPTSDPHITHLTYTLHERATYSTLKTSFNPFRKPRWTEKKQTHTRDTLINLAPSPSPYADEPVPVLSGYAVGIPLDQWATAIADRGGNNAGGMVQQDVRGSIIEVSHYVCVKLWRFATQGEANLVAEVNIPVKIAPSY
ncbi:uncharacterized protein EV422DRAFT_46238 [Fimicolochytrium jonesii]|uniref:uncharacterized protein n=1 Tax=Fimicolochytrium jonesii TaxID=1396493 RepID=UPI0022FE16CE|nr:uncharacterized protein EV422DRAFT_46238 [Fimicolochytrium jonesii]KAI8820951.1 hypothetical protein EV422DRAFT_46238 [Fimicolochytrium jonesii]